MIIIIKYMLGDTKKKLQHVVNSLCGWHTFNFYREKRAFLLGNACMQTHIWIKIINNNIDGDHDDDALLPESVTPYNAEKWSFYWVYK